MKWIQFPMLLSVLFLAACNNAGIYKLNNTIVGGNEELTKKSGNFLERMKTVKNYDYSVLEADRREVAEIMERRINEVMALDASMPGGEEFRKAFVDYYRLEKEVYETDFKELCAVKGGEGADTKVNEIVKKMADKGMREDELEKRIHTTQEAFASKNNLRLH